MAERPPPPAEIAWLVDLVGETAELAVIEEHAGTRVFVAANAKKGVNKLIGDINPQGAEKFAYEFGGNHVRISACKHWRARLLRFDGKSNAEIARALGLDRSSVSRILQQAAKSAAAYAPGRAADIQQLTLKLD